MEVGQKYIIEIDKVTYGDEAPMPKQYGRVKGLGFLLDQTQLDGLIRLSDKSDKEGSTIDNQSSISDKEPKLTEKNLQRYGEIVLTRDWRTTTGAYITEKYIIWRKPNKRDQMYLLTMCNGEAITMRRI